MPREKRKQAQTRKFFGTNIKNFGTIGSPNTNVKNPEEGETCRPRKENEGREKIREIAMKGEVNTIKEGALEK